MLSLRLLVMLGALFSKGVAQKPASHCALLVKHSGAQMCIDYESVSAAYAKAKTVIGLPVVNGTFSNANVGNLAKVLQETSRLLAEQFDLPPDVVANGLPMIDTRKTAVADDCPAFAVTPTKCRVERYRNIGGLCNNLEHPHWGAAKTSHIRYLAPDFADGLAAPRLAKSRKALPSARLVSATAHQDLGFHDHVVTVMLVAWGQFVDHDITLTAETKDPFTNKVPKCCEGHRHPDCFPVEISKKDPFYSEHDQVCMNVARSIPGLKHDCRLGARSSFNLVSSVLDAGTVYGDSDALSRKLRSFEGGLLKALPVFEDVALKALLPLKLEVPDDGCIRPSADIYCFLAGDNRVNEQTVLAVMHTLLVREHNRIARELAVINPHWNDETLYQEARHIVAALVQHITYNEFLPMVLGKEVMRTLDLILSNDGHWKGYDPTVDASADIGFTTAAFRMGHTLLPSVIERWSTSHKYIGAQRLSEMLQQPYDLYKRGWMDTYMVGLSNQVAQAYDDSVTREVTNHLFQEPGQNFGKDLLSLNLQRGRDHGLPAYTRWRDWCGLPSVNGWADLAQYMDNRTVAAYQLVYASPDDIDLWSAGVSEKPLPGSLIGPTFACIIGRQFRSLRRGDRFWYENGGWPSSFTLEQLSEIRKSKLSRLLCDNSDGMETVQVYAMVLPDHQINPRVKCRSSVLPRLDLTKWKDSDPAQEVRI